MTTPLPPAPHGRRLIARAVDVAAVSAASTVAGVIVGGVAGLRRDALGISDVGAYVAGLLAAAIVLIAAQLAVVVVPTALTGRSLGKAVTGLAVVPAGGRGRWWRAPAREVAFPILLAATAYAGAAAVVSASPDPSVGEWFPPLLLAALIAADAATALLRPDHRTVHDLAAGTVVIATHRAG